MKLSPWQRLDQWARHLLPVGSAVAMMFFAATPFPLPGVAQVMPLFGLMAIYYWAIFRPDLLNAPVAFILGLFQDILLGAPFGIFALVFLLVHGMASSQRRFFLGNTFLVAWWGFALIAAGAIFIDWALLAILFDKTVPGRQALLQYLMTVAAYPPLVWVLARIQAGVLREV